MNACQESSKSLVCGCELVRHLMTREVAGQRSRDYPRRPIPTSDMIQSATTSPKHVWGHIGGSGYRASTKSPALPYWFSVSQACRQQVGPNFRSSCATQRPSSRSAHNSSKNSHTRQTRWAKLQNNAKRPALQRFPTSLLLLRFSQPRRPQTKAMTSRCPTATSSTQSIS